MGKEYRTLKAYRALKGINQDELAKKLGITVARYSQKESGKKPFLLEEAKTLADYFGLTVDQIFFSHELYALKDSKNS